ncbi:MAG TPA: hypothetical protein PL110_14940 [Candidatus Eremiobacteraeota bacterium]|nr:hypothetical protein [Candidatus Eremiobacteraeota bacterium]
MGHSTRMIEVANHIPIIHKITFATCAPEWIYHTNLHRPFFYRRTKIDAGVIQSDLLTILEEETLNEFAFLNNHRDEIIKEEVKWNKTNQVDIIISDIPAMAFPIARKLSIPSVGISNFTWDWIYGPMVKKYPHHTHLIENLCNDYKEAELFLCLPMYGKLPFFREVKFIPFIASKSSCSPEEIRKKLSIEGRRKLILCSFGGHEMASINFSQVAKELDEFTLISFNPQFPSEYPDFITLKDEKNILHADIVAAADIVVCKPGYGIVSETIANCTKVLYTCRKDLIENTVLVEGLRNFAIAEEIPNKDFLKGKWGSYIHRLLQKNKTFLDVDCSGAEVAVKEIFNLIKI